MIQTSIMTDTMTDEEIEQTQKEADEVIQNFKEQEKQGLRDILR